jgi:hypothetical protein
MKRRRRRGRLSDADCLEIRALLDQVIAGRLSVEEGDRRAAAIRDRARATAATPRRRTSKRKS